MKISFKQIHLLLVLIQFYILIFKLGTRYFWKVCNQSDIEDCLSSKEFFINPLPDYHADQITINTINEQEYASGINILDFESLGYSLAVNKYGEPIWFTKKENFNMNKL